MAQRQFGEKKRTLRFGTEKEKKQRQAAISAKIGQMIDLADYETDPFGSYTGIAENPWEIPMQDADDL